MSVEVTHHAETHRFEAILQGQVAAIDYSLEGGIMTILHTNVPAELAGHGIAGDLTRVALDTARANNWEVIAACSYAAAFIKRHPQYADILA